MSAVNVNPSFTANKQNFTGRKSAFTLKPSFKSDKSDTAEITKVVDNLNQQKSSGLKHKISGKLKAVPKKISKAFTNKMMHKAKEIINQTPTSKLMNDIEKTANTSDKDIAAMLDQSAAGKKLPSRVKSQLVKIFKKVKEVLKKMAPGNISELLDNFKNGETGKLSFSGKKKALLSKTLLTGGTYIASGGAGLFVLGAYLASINFPLGIALVTAGLAMAAGGTGAIVAGNRLDDKIKQK